MNRLSDRALWAANNAKRQRDKLIDMIRDDSVSGTAIAKQEAYCDKAEDIARDAAGEAQDEEYFRFRDNRLNKLCDLIVKRIGQGFTLESMLCIKKAEDGLSDADIASLRKRVEAVLSNI